MQLADELLIATDTFRNAARARQPSSTMNPSPRGHDGMLDEVASKRLLRESGIRVPRSIVVPAGGNVSDDVGGLAAPFALKAIAPGVVHKSDVGGVRLDLRDASSVRDAMHAMSAGMASRGHSLTGFLLEEMAPKGHEVVIGGLNDGRFGPVIMFGLGGIFVEVFADVAFRICPIAPRDAYDMIGSLRGAAILRGARGGMRVRLAPLVDALLRIGGPDGLLMKLMPGFRELDVNPLVVSTSSVIAVDARIRLA